MIDAVAMYALMATVFPIGKVSLRYVQPIFLTGVRMLFGGSLLLMYQYWYNRAQFSFDHRYLKPLAIMVIFNIYLTNVCEFWGLQYLDAGKACFIYNLSPFFAALFSYRAFGEIMTLRKWVGLIIGILSFFPILLHQSSGEVGLGGLLFVSWAELALLVAAISTAYGWNTMRKVVLAGSLSPLFANGVSMFIGGLLIMPTSYLLENWNPIPVTNVEIFLGSVLILTFISNIFGYNIYGFLLKKYTSTFLSFASFLGSLFAALYGWLFLHEHITWYFVVSMLGVCFGLIIFYKEELRQGYIAR